MLFSLRRFFPWPLSSCFLPLVPRQLCLEQACAALVAILQEGPVSLSTCRRLTDVEEFPPREGSELDLWLHGPPVSAEVSSLVPHTLQGGRQLSGPLHPLHGRCSSSPADTITTTAPSPYSPPALTLSALSPPRAPQNLPGVCDLHRAVRAQSGMGAQLHARGAGEDSEQRADGAGAGGEGRGGGRGGACGEKETGNIRSRPRRPPSSISFPSAGTSTSGRISRGGGEGGLSRSRIVLSKRRDVLLHGSAALLPTPAFHSLVPPSLFPSPPPSPPLPLSLPHSLPLPLPSALLILLLMFEQLKTVSAGLLPPSEGLHLSCCGRTSEEPIQGSVSSRPRLLLAPSFALLLFFRPLTSPPPGVLRARTRSHAASGLVSNCDFSSSSSSPLTCACPSSSSSLLPEVSLPAPATERQQEKRGREGWRIVTGALDPGVLVVSILLVSPPRLLLTPPTIRCDPIRSSSPPPSPSLTLVPRVLCSRLVSPLQAVAAFLARLSSPSPARGSAAGSALVRSSALPPAPARRQLQPSSSTSSSSEPSCSPPRWRAAPSFSTSSLLLSPSASPLPFTPAWSLRLSACSALRSPPPAASSLPPYPVHNHHTLRPTSATSILSPCVLRSSCLSAVFSSSRRSASSTACNPLTPGQGHGEH
eukprot:760856-Hanusia_phi.AAC.2